MSERNEDVHRSVCMKVISLVAVGLLLAGLFVSGCSERKPVSPSPSSPDLPPSPNQQANKAMPAMNPGWIPISGGPIEACLEANIPLLKDALREKNDLELRIWKGFGLQITGLQGLILTRVEGTWEATHLAGYSPELKPGGGNLRQWIDLDEPRSGWDGLWRQLDDLDVLTLPDATQLEGEVGVLDGTAYVVELCADGTYRTYHYNNPSYQPWPEAKKMLAIDKLIRSEFSQVRW